MRGSADNLTNFPFLQFQSEPHNFFWTLLFNRDTEVGNILRFLFFFFKNVFILRCSEILSWKSGKGRNICFGLNWLFSCYFPRKVFVNKWEVKPHIFFLKVSQAGPQFDNGWINLEKEWGKFYCLFNVLFCLPTYKNILREEQGQAGQKGEDGWTNY